MTELGLEATEGIVFRSLFGVSMCNPSDTRFAPSGKVSAAGEVQVLSL